MAYNISTDITLVVVESIDLNPCMSVHIIASPWLENYFTLSIHSIDLSITCENLNQYLDI